MYQVLRYCNQPKRQLYSIIKVYSNNAFYLKDFNWWKNKGYVGNGIKTTQNHQIVWLQIKKACHAFLHAFWHLVSCHDMISHWWRLATMGASCLEMGMTTISATTWIMCQGTMCYNFRMINQQELMLSHKPLYLQTNDNNHRPITLYHIKQTNDNNHRPITVYHLKQTNDNNHRPITYHLKSL